MVGYRWVDYCVWVDGLLDGRAGGRMVDGLLDWLVDGLVGGWAGGWVALPLPRNPSFLPLVAPRLHPAEC